MQNFLSRVFKLNIYVLVFLMPLFFLPFSFEVLEYNKGYLLFFSVSLAIFLWLVRMIVYEKEIKIRYSWLDFFVAGFLFLAIISAFFSIDQHSSVYGFYGRFSNGLISLLSLGALYFLIVNNTSAKPGASPFYTRSLMKVFLWSGSLALLVGYFSVFGLWAQINKLVSLPPFLLQKTFNPVAGSLEGLSVFLAIFLIVLLGKIVVGLKDKESQEGFVGRATPYFLILAALVMMALVDFWPAWFTLLAPLVVFTAVSVVKRLFRENVNCLLLPILLIIAAAALIPLRPPQMGLPQEQVVSQPMSWQVGFSSAAENVKNGFLGSGIGTFHYDFAKHKPLLMNQSWLWSIRFDRAGSHLAEILSTMGFLAVFIYLGLIGVFFLIVWLLLGIKKEEFKGIKMECLFFLAVFSALVAGQFVYYQNVTLAFAFWLFLGISAASWQIPFSVKSISFKSFPELSLVFTTLVFVFGIVLLGFYFYAVKFYLADFHYAKGLTGPRAERVQEIEKAARLNLQNPSYRTALARAYMAEALDETAKPVKEQNATRIQLLVAGAIEQGRVATVLQSNQVANWETLGVIYREIRGAAAGAAEWGIKSFEKAIELEPTNPVLYTELGKLYLATGDNAKAKEYFGKAAAKKSDYADVLIQQALLLEKEEILDQAIEKLEGLVGSNPYDIEGLFQLGRLYFNSGKTAEAIVLLKRITTLVPNHSNAHYALGVIYAAGGQVTLAIESFQKVLELNPGNQDVIQKLEDLRGKKR